MTNQYEVTREQFQELVNKMWSGEMTMKELDKYEIVLPFAPNHENEVINDLINKLCDDARKEEYRTLFTGSSRHVHHELLLQNEFKYMSDWSDGYRNVYVSESNKAIVTYCEGDFSVSLMNTPNDYKFEFNRCVEFYNEN